MAHERWRRSGVWREKMARKRYERLHKLDNTWLTLLVNAGKLIEPNTSQRRSK